MPIYEQTYREYTGTYWQRFRWWIIIQQELRLLLKSRFFLITLLFSLLHFILRLMQITAFDIIAQDPNSTLAMFFANIENLEVNALMFYDFLRVQSALVFLVLLFAGSGMICNDVKHNLMEIYFSKPITWKDYALGKVLGLSLIGFIHTMIPALVLVIMHNLMLPGLDTLRDSAPWFFAIIGYSLAYVLPTALVVLASSALIKSKNFAAVSVLMVLIANTALGTTLAEVMRESNYYIVAFPLAVNRIGQQFFGDTRLEFSLRYEWSLLYVAVVSVVMLLIILRRVRQAEVAQ